MSWLTRLAMRLYPSRWRARYGPELEALVEQSDATWRTAVDIAKGALIMRLSDIVKPAYQVIACMLLGAAGGTIVAGTAPAHHSSVFDVEFESPAQSTEDRVREIASAAFSDANLERLIAQFGLYRKAGRPGSDAVRQLRSDIALLWPHRTRSGCRFSKTRQTLDKMAVGARECRNGSRP